MQLSTSLVWYVSREELDNDVHDEAGENHATDQDVFVGLGPPLDQPHDGVGHAENWSHILQNILSVALRT